MKYKLIILLLIPGLFSCKMEKKETASGDSQAVTTDEYYTSLFDRTGDGFTGGDGTYSVKLPDGRTAWIFGDTFIGGVNPDNTRRKEVPIYIRNSVVIQDGDSLETLYSMYDGLKASFVKPPAVVFTVGAASEDSVWFWPGDAYIENGDFHLFLSEFTQVDTGMWDFRWENSWLAVYELPGFQQKSITLLPQGRKTGVHLGHAVMMNDQFTYVYGLKEGKPYVSRYPPGDFNGRWEYFDGSGWSQNPLDIKAMADFSGSEQFSVFKLKDLYILVTQMGGFSTEIGSFTSDSPWGPWQNKTVLYKTPVPDTTTNIFTYNALAHPDLIKDGKLLVSYNMNSMVLEDHFRNADIYRPRFIRVPLEMIDSSLVK